MVFFKVSSIHGVFEKYWGSTLFAPAFAVSKIHCNRVSRAMNKFNTEIIGEGEREREREREGERGGGKEIICERRDIFNLRTLLSFSVHDDVVVQPSATWNFKPRVYMGVNESPRV